MANALEVDSLDLALHAIHDPTRRRVLELLKDGERSVRQLTDAADVTQSAISQHLKVLREAELVAVRPEGTRRLYRIDTRGLNGVRAWVDSFWDDALDAFIRHADAARADSGGDTGGAVVHHRKEQS